MDHLLAHADTDTPSADPLPRGSDAFVFRRVSEGVYAHLGGRGRGEGWAGIVQLSLEDEPALSRAIIALEQVVRSTSTPQRLFGPYWTREGVIVPLDHDEVVVLGGVGVAALSPQVRIDCARRVSDEVGEVGPAKRLADELELLHAVKAVALIELTTLEDVATNVVNEAARALSCEVGVLHLPESGITVVADCGAPQHVSVGRASALAEVMNDRIVGVARCFQELTPEERRALPPWTDDVLSALVVPLDLEDGAVLLLAHTVAGPRGFTDLCQDIGRHVADAARTVLMAAVQQERLRRHAAEASLHARTDELTGLLNRRGWEHELAALPTEPDTIVSVIVADGNHLKRINDDAGHEIGDRHLRGWADALRQHVRESDPLARIGGDEFAALLVGADATRSAAVVGAVRATMCDSELESSMAMGHATGTMGELDELVRAADAAMYVDKGDARRC